MSGDGTARFEKRLEERLFLVFTGQQRLAKNTLINALRRYSITPLTVGGENTVQNLIRNAERGFSQLQISLQSIHVAEENKTTREKEEVLSLIDDAIDGLAVTLSDYWRLKKEMASGSEPENIRRFLLYLQPIAQGMSLCGAGAGGGEPRGNNSTF